MTCVLHGEDEETGLTVWSEVGGVMPESLNLGRTDAYISPCREIDQRVSRYFPGLACYARPRLPGDYGPLDEEFVGTHVFVQFADDNVCLFLPCDLTALPRTTN